VVAGLVAESRTSLATASAFARCAPGSECT
jgi:hypothetical protein